MIQKRNVQLAIDEPEYRRFKALLALEGKGVGEYLVEAIHRYIRHKENKAALSVGESSDTQD